MCIIKPVNKEEMLSVSGVGEFKYEKYGERFLAAVREQTMNILYFKMFLKKQV